MDAGLGLAGSARFIATVGSVVVAAGVGLGFVRFVGASPAERGMTAVVGSAALGLVVCAPGLLALLALADRPALLLPAAVALVPLSLLSFALVTLPLIVPAEMLLVAFTRRSAGRARDHVGLTLATVVPLGLLMAATVALFLRDDPRSYTTATAAGWTGDVITVAEALLSFTFSAAAIAAGWALSSPRRSPWMSR